MKPIDFDLDNKRIRKCTFFFFEGCIVITECEIK